MFKKQSFKEKFINSNMIKRWIRKYSDDSFDKDFCSVIYNRYPQILNIELTNKCPMKCVACPRTYAMTREEGFMDMELFKKIIDEYAKYNLFNDTVWLHHFGESLLHPEFDKALEYAREKGINAGISLNPLVLTEEKAQRLFKAKPAEVFFMLDGDSDETFYQIRGVKGSYDISIKHAIYGVEMKEKFSPETKLQITMIDNPQFKDVVNNAEKFWKEHYNIVLERKPFWVWNGDVEKINDMERNALNQGRKDYTCKTPWMNVCITYDGSVVPCCADYNNLYVLGNIKNESIHRIWNGKPMQALRKEILSGDVKNKLCRNCSYTKHN